MAKKKGSPWTIIIVALLTFAAGIVFMAWYGERLLPPPVPEKAAMKGLKLFFSDADGKALKAEERRIKKGPPRGMEEKVKEAIRALIEGPKGDLGPTIPEGTKLLSVEIKGRTAHVNFNGALAENHPGGSSGELQTIYSIVNTITLNFPEIEAVQILVEGDRIETLAGHIIINLPIGPDKKLIKG
jgi:spore germination protein GerM